MTAGPIARLDKRNADLNELSECGQRIDTVPLVIVIWQRIVKADEPLNTRFGLLLQHRARCATTNKVVIAR